MASNDDRTNVGIAFAVTCGAGAATALGAAVVFVPSLVRYADRKTLAGALGLSGGVMIYVSFIEIFQKSRKAFVASGLNDDTAYIYATVSFFGGVVFMMTLNQCVTKLLRGGHHHDGHGHELVDHISSQSKFRTNTTNVSRRDEDDEGENETAEDVAQVAICACCSSNPVEDLQNIQRMAQALETEEEEAKQQEEDEIHEDLSQQHSHCHSCDKHGCDVEGQSSNHSDHGLEDDKKEAHSPDGKLMRMSINTAIAIGLHNFPEGLASFVATLNDPKVGLVLGIAIAIHNIPEGLCVAMPVYYATGNRWKAFAWGVLSGITEPIAAVLGYAVLANSFSDVMYAVLFGLVAGMMVIITVRELLPTAHRYDPEDTVVTYSFVAGMGIMALSLVLFLL